MLIYNLFVPPTSIDKETFVRIDICCKCFSYEHKMNDCHSPNVIVCSECAAVNHRFKDCTSNIKKCTNCDGPHHTLAEKCPVRKNLVKEKAKKIRERSRSRSMSRNANTYAQAVAGKQYNRECCIYRNIYQQS